MCEWCNNSNYKHFFRLLSEGRIMSLHNKIRNIYPSLTDADFSFRITLQNDSDGKGDYIAKWEHPNFAKPTDAQLAAASDEWTPPSLTVAEKLAAAGISITDLKSLLGLS